MSKGLHGSIYDGPRTDMVSVIVLLCVAVMWMMWRTWRVWRWRRLGHPSGDPRRSLMYKCIRGQLVAVEKSLPQRLLSRRATEIAKGGRYFCVATLAPKGLVSDMGSDGSVVQVKEYTPPVTCLGQRLGIGIRGWCTLVLGN